jgi:hypothetical protein
MFPICQQEKSFFVEFKLYNCYVEWYTEPWRSGKKPILSSWFISRHCTIPELCAMDWIHNETCLVIYFHFPKSVQRLVFEYCMHKHWLTILVRRFSRLGFSVQLLHLDTSRVVCWVLFSSFGWHCSCLHQGECLSVALIWQPYVGQRVWMWWNWLVDRKSRLLSNRS